MLSQNTKGIGEFSILTYIGQQMCIDELKLEAYILQVLRPRKHDCQICYLCELGLQQNPQVLKYA